MVTWKTKRNKAKKARYYQVLAAQTLLALMYAGKKPLGELAGGGGKTLIIAMIMYKLVQDGKRVLYIAHRRELLLQVQKKLTEDGGLSPSFIGLMMGGKKRNLDRPIQVASIQTLQNMKDLRGFDCIVFDECHRAVAKSYQNVVAQLPNAMVVGLTATPTRLDGKPLGAAFTDLIKIEKISVLIAKGFLSRPRCFSDKKELLPDLKGLVTLGGDFDLKELAKRVDLKDLRGAILANYCRVARGRQFIGFASSVKHSRKLVEEFTAAGIPCAHLDGKTPQPERDEVVRRFRAGELVGIWNFDILTEGFDLPACRVCIMARPTKSLVKYLQQAARVMRVYNDEDAIILDHALNVVRHFFPDEDREYTLEQGEVVPDDRLNVKVCPECGEMVPSNAHVCPGCGYSFAAKERKDLEVRQAQLEEVDRAMFEKKAAEILAAAKKEKIKNPEAFTKEFMEEWKRHNASR